LEVDPSAGHRLAGAERLALVDHGRDQCALRAGVEPDVEETGAGDLGGTHARILGEDGRDLLCELARGRTDLLAQLQRDVGRVVAAFRVPGARDDDRVGHDRDGGPPPGETSEACSRADGGERGTTTVSGTTETSAPRAVRTVRTAARMTAARWAGVTSSYPRCRHVDAGIRTHGNTFGPLAGARCGRRPAPVLRSVSPIRHR